MRGTIELTPGVKTVIDSSGGTFTAATVQDCTPIAEQMKAMHNEGLTGSSDMRYVGRIPNVMVEKYCNDNGITYAEFMGNREHIKRLSSDPAMDHFRVWKGAL
jgi:hypothetical protein